MSYWFDWVETTPDDIPFDPQRMAEHAARLLGITLPMAQNGKRRKAVYYRMVIAEFMRKNGKSVKDIGRVLGYSDHTTAVHLIKQAKNLNYLLEVQQLKQRLYE